jgi:hypothetical protein
LNLIRTLDQAFRPDPKKINGVNFLLASSIPFCYTMGMLPITIRKRTIAKADLELIQATVNEHWDIGENWVASRCRPLNGKRKVSFLCDLCGFAVKDEKSVLFFNINGSRRELP